MPEPAPDATEREDLLAQLRELSGFQPTAPQPKWDFPLIDQPVVPPLTGLELRRLRPHIECLTEFRAEQGRLPSAGPAAAARGRALWGRGHGDNGAP